MHETEEAVLKRACDEVDQHRPVKVLHLVDDTERGPRSARLAALLARLQRLQVRSLVISIDDYGAATEKIQARSVTVVSLEAPRDRRGSMVENLGALLRLRPLLRRAEPDLIQAWGPRAERMARLLVAGRRLPLLATGLPAAPAGAAGRLGQLALDLVLPEPPRLLADHDEALLLDETRCVRAPVRVIGAGIDLAAVRSAPALGLEELPTGPLRIGLPVRPGHGRSLRSMLEAFRPLAALRADLRLVVIGEPGTVELRPWVEDLGLAGRVELRSWPQEPAALLRRLDLLWAHDRPRPDQGTILTAMAIGVPVVCDHDTGLGGDIREIGGALMRDARWPRQFAEATRELLDDDGLRAAVARAGRILVEERHGLERQAESLRRVYDELLDGSARP
ncbi:MAG: glycosyltransferase family 4 protein [Planctomycetes bacterium]|nr:glycosyltransferase family 4 protein [Planctomycetota bacterium]